MAAISPGSTGIGVFPAPMIAITPGADKTGSLFVATNSQKR
jgi:hypothetical protein